MANFPNLPGYSYTDLTERKFHVSHNFDMYNGFRVSRGSPVGIGGKELDIHSSGYINNIKPVRFDPLLTYGRSRGAPLPNFVPEFITKEKKSLTYTAFFKQTVVLSAEEHYRVRVVKIIYFIEDDTIQIMEPIVPNCGIQQGRFFRRGKIPKSNHGYWHWKDFNIGVDVTLNGVSFHIVDCDEFTKEYLAAQGIVLNPKEDIPPDPYLRNKEILAQMRTPVKKDNKFITFLQYTNKYLKFNGLWDDTDAECGDKKEVVIIYNLLVDTITVKIVPKPILGLDVCTLLLKRLKIPKVWCAYPVMHPGYLELTEEDILEYYAPKDLIIGETVYFYGKKILLLDCDEFTRNYYKTMLKITQGPAIKIPEEKDRWPARVKPPKPIEEELRRLLNANKYLRYTMKMDSVHPEDSIREFVLLYSLAHGTIQIFELNIPNSGIMGGKFLRSSFIEKPGSDPKNPDYYTPADFAIRATIHVNKHKFIVTGADVRVYHYMEANPEKFPEDVVRSMKHYLVREGYLSVLLKDKKEKDLKVPTIDDVEIYKPEREICFEEIEANLREAENKFRGQELNVKNKVHFEDEQHQEDTTKTDVKLLEGKANLADLFEKHYPPSEEEITRRCYQDILKRQKDLCQDNK